MMDNETPFSFDLSSSSFSFGETCTQCTRKDKEIQLIRQDLAACHSNFKTLKQKIIATDQLLRKFKAKSDECLKQEKEIEEWVRKYEKSQGEVTVLEAQLRKTLEDMEPVKKIKGDLEKHLEMMAKEKEKLQTQLNDAEYLNNQYEMRVANLETAKSDKDRVSVDTRRKHSALESKLKQQGNKINKLQAESKALKLESTKQGRKESRLEKQLKRTQAKLLKHLDILVENGLMTKKAKASVVATASRLDRDGDSDEWSAGSGSGSDNEDGSMLDVASDLEDKEDHASREPGNKLPISQADIAEHNNASPNVSSTPVLPNKALPLPVQSVPQFKSPRSRMKKVASTARSMAEQRMMGLAVKKLDEMIGPELWHSSPVSPLSPPSDDEEEVVANDGPSESFAGGDCPISPLADDDDDSDDVPDDGEDVHAMDKPSSSSPNHSASPPHQTSSPNQTKKALVSSSSSLSSSSSSSVLPVMVSNSVVSADAPQSFSETLRQQPARQQSVVEGNQPLCDRIREKDVSRAVSKMGDGCGVVENLRTREKLGTREKAVSEMGDGCGVVENLRTREKDVSTTVSEKGDGCGVVENLRTREKLGTREKDVSTTVSEMGDGCGDEENLRTREKLGTREKDVSRAVSEMGDTDSCGVVENLRTREKLGTREKDVSRAVSEMGDTDSCGVVENLRTREKLGTREKDVSRAVSEMGDGCGEEENFRTREKLVTKDSDISRAVSETGSSRGEVENFRTREKLGTKDSDISRAVSETGSSRGEVENLRTREKSRTRKNDVSRAVSETGDNCRKEENVRTDTRTVEKNETNSTTLHPSNSGGSLPTSQKPPAPEKTKDVLASAERLLSSSSSSSESDHDTSDLSFSDSSLPPRAPSKGQGKGQGRGQVRRSEKRTPMKRRQQVDVLKSKAKIPKHNHKMMISEGRQTDESVPSRTESVQDFHKLPESSTQQNISSSPASGLPLPECLEDESSADSLPALPKKKAQRIVESELSESESEKLESSVKLPSKCRKTNVRPHRQGKKTPAIVESDSSDSDFDTSSVINDPSMDASEHSLARENFTTVTSSASLSKGDASSVADPSKAAPEHLLAPENPKTGTTSTSLCKEDTSFIITHPSKAASEHSLALEKSKTESTLPGLCKGDASREMTTGSAVETSATSITTHPTIAASKHSLALENSKPMTPSRREMTTGSAVETSATSITTHPTIAASKHSLALENSKPMTPSHREMTTTPSVETPADDLTSSPQVNNTPATSCEQHSQQPQPEENSAATSPQKATTAEYSEKELSKEAATAECSEKNFKESFKDTYFTSVQSLADDLALSDSSDDESPGSDQSQDGGHFVPVGICYQPCHPDHQYASKPVEAVDSPGENHVQDAFISEELSRETSAPVVLSSEELSHETSAPVVLSSEELSHETSAPVVLSSEELGHETSAPVVLSSEDLGHETSAPVPNPVTEDVDQSAENCGKIEQPVSENTATPPTDHSLQTREDENLAKKEEAASCQDLPKTEGSLIQPCAELNLSDIEADCTEKQMSVRRNVIRPAAITLKSPVRELGTSENDVRSGAAHEGDCSQSLQQKNGFVPVSASRMSETVAVPVCQRSPSVEMLSPPRPSHTPTLQIGGTAHSRSSPFKRVSTDRRRSRSGTSEDLENISTDMVDVSVSSNSDLVSNVSGDSSPVFSVSSKVSSECVPTMPVSSSVAVSVVMSSCVVPVSTVCVAKTTSLPVTIVNSATSSIASVSIAKTIGSSVTAVNSANSPAASVPVAKSTSSPVTVMSSVDSCHVTSVSLANSMVLTNSIMSVPVASVSVTESSNAPSAAVVIPTVPSPIACVSKSTDTTPVSVTQSADFSATVSGVVSSTASSTVPTIGKRTSPRLSSVGHTTSSSGVVSSTLSFTEPSGVNSTPYFTVPSVGHTTSSSSVVSSTLSFTEPSGVNSTPYSTVPSVGHTTSSSSVVSSTLSFTEPSGVNSTPYSTVSSVVNSTASSGVVNSVPSSIASSEVPNTNCALTVDIAVTEPRNFPLVSKTESPQSPVCDTSSTPFSPSHPSRSVSSSSVCYTQSSEVASVTDCVREKSQTAELCSTVETMQQPSSAEAVAVSDEEDGISSQCESLDERVDTGCYEPGASSSKSTTESESTVLLPEVSSEMESSRSSEGFTTGRMDEVMEILNMFTKYIGNCISPLPSPEPCEKCQLNATFSNHNSLAQQPECASRKSKKQKHRQQKQTLLISNTDGKTTPCVSQNSTTVTTSGYQGFVSASTSSQNRAGTAANPSSVPTSNQNRAGVSGYQGFVRASTANQNRETSSVSQGSLSASSQNGAPSTTANQASVSAAIPNQNAAAMAATGSSAVSSQISKIGQLNAAFGSSVVSHLKTSKRQSPIEATIHQSPVETLKRQSPIETVKCQSPVQTLKRHSPLQIMKRLSSRQGHGVKAKSSANEKAGGQSSGLQNAVEHAKRELLLRQQALAEDSDSASNASSPAEVKSTSSVSVPVAAGKGKTAGEERNAARSITVADTVSRAATSAVQPQPQPQPQPKTRKRKAKDSSPPVVPAKQPNVIRRKAVVSKGSLGQKVQDIVGDYYCESSVPVETVIGQLKQIGRLSECWVSVILTVVMLLKSEEKSLQAEIVKACARSNLSAATQKQLSGRVFMDKEEVRFMHLLLRCTEEDSGCDRVRLMQTLWSSIFSASGLDRINVTQRASLCRLFVGVCGSSGRVEEVRVLAYQLALRSYDGLVTILLAIAAAWPRALARHSPTDTTGVVVVMEHIVMTTIAGNPAMAKLAVCFERLCQWEHTTPDPVSLMNLHIKALQTAFENGHTASSSPHVYELCRCVEMICATNDTMWLVKNFLERSVRSALLKWSQKGEAGSSHHLVVVLCRLVGQVIRPDLRTKAKVLTQLMNAQVRSVLFSAHKHREVETACVEMLLSLSPLKPQMAFNILHEYCSKAGTTNPATTTLTPSLQDRILALKKLVNSRLHYKM